MLANGQMVKKNEGKNVALSAANVAIPPCANLTMMAVIVMLYFIKKSNKAVSRPLTFPHSTHFLYLRYFP